MLDNNIALNGQTVKCLACGEKTALEEEFEGITSWLCTSCGYTSNTQLTKNSRELLMSPKTIQMLKKWDKEREIYWILTVINMPTRGLLFPEEHGSQIIWTYVPIVDIPNEEQRNYPIENSNAFHTRKLDPTHSKKFTRFSDGLIEMGAIISKDELGE